MRHRPLLDDLALRHHADPVRDLAHDAEVVGDEQHAPCRARLFRSASSLQDLRLHGDVERRRGLVGDQQVRLVGERHRDHHALALPAGQLVRIGAEPRLRHPGCRPACSNSTVRLPRRRARQPLVQVQDLADLPLDAVQRVQRRHGFLEHHRDVVAADLAQLVLGRAHQVRALEQDLTRRVRGRRIGQQLQDRQRRDRLARAGFADDRDRLARRDIERHAVDRQRLLARPGGRRRRDRGRRGGEWSLSSLTSVDADSSRIADADREARERSQTLIRQSCTDRRGAVALKIVHP